MTHSVTGSSDRFSVTRHAAAEDVPREPARSRRLSLPLRMDDGQIRIFDLPSALERPSQFSAAELERLTRAYAEALGLLGPSPTSGT
jgi:hypothetical protein